MTRTIRTPRSNPRLTHTPAARGVTQRLVLPVAATLGMISAAGVAGAHEGDVQPGGVAPAHHRAGAGAELADLKRSLAPFQDVQAAVAAGFVPVSSCTVSPDGGMGVHYLHPARAAAPVDAERPAILLYGPDRDGGMKLLGAEWFQADRDQDTATDDDRPSLFGRPFDGPMAGHEGDMPVHYDLHVWLFDANPAGVFAPWNPSVTC